MIYLCPSDNAASSIAMTNQAASDVYAERSKTGTGSGTAAVTGGYTGANDSVIEVEVVDLAGATRPHTLPQVAGAGNGSLTVSLAGSVAAQEFTVTLRDAGSPAQFASVPLFGVILRAAAAGAGGNGIALTITPTWTETATPYSLPGDIGAGASQIGIGAAWNFGAPDLLDDGTLPASAPILRFGDDSHLCRAYRTFADGQYTYFITPAPPRAIPADVPVWSLTGGVSAKLTQGATVESYGPHATIYALLNAIRQGSALVTIDGVVADDRRPGQMGIAPVSLRTDGHIQSSVRTGSEAIREAAVIASAVTTSGTESVTVECVDKRAGGERWRLRGAISGIIGEMSSGQTFTGGPIASLLIPERDSGSTGTVSANGWNIGLSWQPSAPTSPDCMLLWRPRIGREATPKTLTFVYTERTKGDGCDCENQPIAGLPDTACLGISEQGGGDMDALAGVKEIKRREVESFLSTLVMTQNVAKYHGPVAPGPIYERHTAWIYAINENYITTLKDGAQSDNIYERPQDGIIPAPTLASNSWFLSVLDAIKSRILGALGVALDAEMQPPVWEASTEYGFGQMVRRTQDDYTRWFMAQNFGTSGASEPSWSATLESNTTDSSVTWKAYASRYQEWLTAWASFQTLIVDETDGLPDDWLNPDVNGSVPEVIARRYTENFAVSSGKSEADSLTGTDCWRDTGAPFWWVNVDGPYLPIFTNTYYHSAIAEYDDADREIIRGTREFGFALQTCASKLEPGDRVVITITAGDAIVPSVGGYQVGDTITFQLVRGEAVTTAGGRNAVTTQVWSVRGSVVGGLPDYTVSNPSAPPTYSQSGVTLTLVPGTIPFRLGDQITFAAEGARVRWRRDGGSWSATADIGPLSIGDGMTLTFTGGPAPAWVAGDRWVIDAIAVHGASRMISPRTDGVGKWTADSDITAATVGPVRVAALLGVTGITSAELVASDDDFATEAARVTMTAAADGWCVVLPAAATHAKWRVETTGAGTAQWLYVGPGRQLTLPTGRPELGVSEISESITPRGLRRSATVNHSACDYASVRALLSVLATARASHDGIIGAVEDSDASSASRYRAPDRIDIDDAFGHQPEPGRRLVSVGVTLGSI